MLIGFVQGYEELKWGISKLNPLCNGPSYKEMSTDIWPGGRVYLIHAPDLCIRKILNFGHCQISFDSFISN